MLRVVDITKAFGSRIALDGVSLTAVPGVTALLGPNGAGKTTLLRCIATVLRPDAGRIEVAGTAPIRAGDLRRIRRRLGYMPQSFGLYPGFTVRRFLDHIAVLKGIHDGRERAQEVTRVIETTDLADVADVKNRRLSGGMRRRVGLAQALLGRPAVVVLDEPTVGLDPEQRIRFRHLLTGAKGPETTVLLSTHLVEDVAAVADQVAVLSAGKVKFAGAPDSLVRLADGKVWHSETPPTDAIAFWQTGSGSYRAIGSPPPGAAFAEPTLEDGYLTLISDDAGSDGH